MAWNDARDTELKRLWIDEGLSASQVANVLGDVTRNAVIGRVHRLGLADRAGDNRPRSRKRRKPRTATPKLSGYRSRPVEIPKAPPPKKVPPAPDARPCTMKELNASRCRWIPGDPDGLETVYCGAETAGGSPYCEHHSQIAFVPAPSRRKNKNPQPEHPTKLNFRNEASYG